MQIKGNSGLVLCVACMHMHANMEQYCINYNISVEKKGNKAFTSHVHSSTCYVNY